MVAFLSAVHLVHYFHLQEVPGQTLDVCRIVVLFAATIIVSLLSRLGYLLECMIAEDNQEEKE